MLLEGRWVGLWCLALVWEHVLSRGLLVDCLCVLGADASPSRFLVAPEGFSGRRGVPRVLLEGCADYATLGLSLFLERHVPSVREDG